VRTSAPRGGAIERGRPRGPAGADSPAAKALAAAIAPPPAAAHLRYVTDTGPGIRRRRRGAGFEYLSPEGRRIDDAETLIRIRSLAIPPAYRDVWICPDPEGHLQATGRDARDRKQYRYHPQWRVMRDAHKFERMLAFGRALPRIRRAVARDLKRPGMPREKVLATIVRLLDTTLIRVGNEEYARENGSFGLTTMRNRHVQVCADAVRFEFRGKGGIAHRVEVNDPRVARVVRRCRDLPGQELFQYLDADGELRALGSGDVNDYLKEIAGGEFTAKDFRTWHATIAALELLAAREFTSTLEAKKLASSAIAEVAKRLGNTPAICRKSYVHPAVVDAFLAGELAPGGEALSGAKRLLRLLVTLARRQRAPRVRVIGRARARPTAKGTPLARVAAGGAPAASGAP
jgi:DNA topoisomerase-1